MTHTYGDGPERHLKLISCNRQAREPDYDRSGVSITFGGQLAVDLFRHFLDTTGSNVPDVMAAVASAVNALEKNAGSPLGLMFKRADIGSYPGITIGLVMPPDPPPPRCG